MLIRRLDWPVISLLSFFWFSTWGFGITLFDGKSGAWSSANVNNQATIAAEGSDFVVCYHSGASLTTVQNWLTTAYNEGLMVIMELPRDIVAAQNVSAIQSYVNALDSYPAVVAWYIFEEPAAGDLQKCATAYNTIHAISSKPITICFSGADTGGMATFADYYDFAMIGGCYPARQYESEFARIVNPPGGTGWRTYIDNAATQMETLGKNWLCIVQAFGAGTSFPGSIYRLPTYKESVFMMNFAVHRGAKAVIFWAHPYIERSYALSTEAYPYDGYQWIEDVYKVLIYQANTVSAALTQPHDETGISVDNSSAWVRHYTDPVTGKHYIRVLNCTSAALNNVTLTVDISGYSKMQRIMSPIHLDHVTKQMTQSFVPFETKWYTFEP